MEGTKSMKGTKQFVRKIFMGYRGGIFGLGMIYSCVLIGLNIFIYD